MKNDMEWKGKYKSELLMVIHQDVQAMYEVGGVSDEEMREFDRDCLVSSPRKARENKSTATTQKPVPVYAASAK
jgi:DNA-binding transcriptional regulator YiaG